MPIVPTREDLRPTSEVPTPGFYRHFKGGEYQVLEVARHSETEELLVLYCSLDDPETMWVRPVEMFSGVVEGPSGLLPRFQMTAPAKRRLGGPLTPLLRVIDALVPSGARQPHRKLLAAR